MFRQLEGGYVLIADYNKRVQVSLSLAGSSAPSSSISRLRELREESVARRKNSSSRSRSSSSSSLVSSKDDDDSDFVDEASKSHLSSILEEGFGFAVVSPARAVALSPLIARSRSSSSSSLVSSKDDDDLDFVDEASKFHLSSILEEGFGSAAVSQHAQLLLFRLISLSLLQSRLSTAPIRLMEADLRLDLPRF